MAEDTISNNYIETPPYICFSKKKHNMGLAKDDLGTP